MFLLVIKLLIQWCLCVVIQNDSEEIERKKYLVKILFKILIQSIVEYEFGVCNTPMHIRCIGS